MGDSQDIRFIGCLSVYIPFTSSSLMVSNFALCCVPFLAGFYSRDFILEMFSIRYINVCLVSYYCLYLQVRQFVILSVYCILCCVVILILFSLRRFDTQFENVSIFRYLKPTNKEYSFLGCDAV